MRLSRRVLISMAGLLALVPLQVRAQALTVSTSGQLPQEKTAPAIPVENQPSKEQLAKLFDVMRIRQQVQSVRNVVPTMVEGQMREQSQAIRAQIPAGQKLTPEQRERLDQLARKYVDKAVNIYPIDEMLSDMTDIYQRHISREDIDAMIAFYSSTPGQHLLDAQPVITQEYMPLVMQRVAERTKTMTAEMMKEAAEITKPAKTGTTKP